MLGDSAPGDPSALWILGTRPRMTGGEGEAGDLAGSPLPLRLGRGSRRRLQSSRTSKTTRSHSRPCAWNPFPPREHDGRYERAPPLRDLVNTVTHSIWHDDYASVSSMAALHGFPAQGRE